MRPCRLWVCLSISVALFVGACEPAHVDGAQERQPSTISEAFHAGGTTVEFKVPCAPDLEVELVAERDDAVVLSATHVPPADGIYPGCLQGYYVKLGAPLGDRLLLDQDGHVIEVNRVAELEPTDQFREVG